MGKVILASLLVLSAAVAEAGVVNNGLKNKPLVIVAPSIVVPTVKAALPKPANQNQLSNTKKVVVSSKQNNKPAPTPSPTVSTRVPEQHFAFLTEDSKKLINDIVNCVDGPREGGQDHVSAVPTPAALPLMATALGIFGITRRRKALK